MSETKSNVNPDSKILETLKGSISEPQPVISHKPGSDGEGVIVRVVKEGSGMIGLEGREDNKEWSGIFNHIVTTARVATFLAEALKKKGEEIDTNLILNTILASHAGRRQWDESKWYPEIVDHAAEKAALGDQPLTTQILHEQGIGGEIAEVVEAHSVGVLYPIKNMDTWEKKLCMYADYRVAQSPIS